MVRPFVRHKSGPGVPIEGQSGAEAEPAGHTDTDRRFHDPGEHLRQAVEIGRERLAEIRLAAL